MAKGYWVVCYREIKDAAALAGYAGPAGAAVKGRRRPVPGAGEDGCGPSRPASTERTVVVEFPSYEQALATHDGPDYRAAAGDARRRGGARLPGDRGRRLTV